MLGTNAFDTLQKQQDTCYTQMKHYADAWGIGNVYQSLVKLEKEQGIRFKPCSLLKEMTDQSKNFYKI